MDTWSNTCRKCDWCGDRYAPRMQNTRYKHKDFCSFKCKEDFIDADNAVNGASDINVASKGSGEDNPARNPTDWMYQYVL